MTIIDPRTGRPAYIGPNGEAALAPGDPRIATLGAKPYVMPDGRTAYYVPWTNTSKFNRALLSSYNPDLPTTSPTAPRTPTPGAGTNPTNGGAGGGGTSNSGQPTGMTSAVLVRDNKGGLYLVNFGASGGGTRQKIDPTEEAKFIGRFGEPLTHFSQLPPAQRWNQIAKFGHGTNTVISLDVRLGFFDGGPAQWDAVDSEDDNEGTGGETGADNRSAHAMIREVLEQYGLGSLSDWAWNMLQNNRSYAEVLLDLRNRPEFKARFKAIDLRRANGLNPVSPEMVMEYENTARDLMRQSGLPSGFYDQFDDFAELIGKGVSLQSVARRIEQSWDRVVNAPSEVRKAFGDLYGIRGDQALAAFMFDPDKAEAQLEKMARSAVAGGAMRAAGFSMDPTTAARLAGFDLDDQTVRGGFARLAQLRSIFTETMGEREDLDEMREGVNSVFDIGAGSEAIARRVERRVNEFGGGGEAYATREGLTGLASY